MRRGYTIIELAFVVGIIGLLAGATIPAYQHVVLRARTDEARAMLHSIAHAELRHHRDHGAYLACPAQGEVPKRPVPFPNALECWRALGVQVDGLLRYRYAVELVDGSFAVLAEGDLDGDGATSRFALSGKDLQLTVKDSLE